MGKAKEGGPPPTSWPAWVVCSNTYEFWQAGCELPGNLQLSAEAAAQVMRIKFYAAEQMQQLEQLREKEEEEDEEEDECVAQLLEQPAAGPMAMWASPAVLAQKAAIMAAAPPSRVSPDVV